MNKIFKTSNHHKKIASSLLFSLCIATAAISLSGCHAATTPEPSSQAAVHKLQGVVVSVDKAKGLLTVKNEDMPGVMEAMTMPYSLANPAAFSTLKAGDKISADYSIKANGAVLDNIKVLSHKSK